MVPRRRSHSRRVLFEGDACRIAARLPQQASQQMPARCGLGGSTT